MKVRTLVFVFVALTGCTAQPPPAAGPLIVIVADHPFLSRGDFAADIQALHDDPVPEESIGLQYEDFLRDLAAVQAEQVAILSSLIREHDLQAVYLEGMTDESAADFRARVLKLGQVDIGRAQRRSGKSENPEVISRADEMLRAYEDELLRIGAAGRLLMANQLDEVLPLDDAATMDNASSSKRSTQFSGPKNDARVAAVAKRLVAGGPVVVAVIAQARNLRDEIAAACPTCRVEVIAPERLGKMNSSQPR